jgi:hypothetical protein
MKEKSMYPQILKILTDFNFKCFLAVLKIRDVSLVQICVICTICGQAFVRNFFVPSCLREYSDGPFSFS